MKKAIIYCRVSSINQAEKELPIESQLSACEKKAKELGATVIREFYDKGKTGRNANRPGFQDAIEFCANNQIDYFITWSSSRFARNKLDAAFYKKILSKHNTTLAYTNMEINPETDGGFILDSIMEMMDELYSRNISKDTMRSLMENAKQGYRNGGTPPFGYYAAPAPNNPKKKVLAINELEAGLVREVFNMRLDGLGARSISMSLNLQHKYKRGKRWAKSSVLYLLANEAYLGYTIYNRANNPPSEWIKIKTHEPIVTKETFLTVNKIVTKDAPNITGEIRNNTTSLFTSLIHCECGAPLTTETANGRSKKYKYYLCSKLKAGDKNDIHTRRINADKVDKNLLDRIMQDIFSVESLTGICNEINASMNAYIESAKKRKKELNSQLAKLQETNQNLWRQIEQTDKFNEALMLRIDENTKQIKLLDSQLQDHTFSVKNKTAKVEPMQLLNKVRKVLSTASIAKKRAFLNNVLTNIRISGDKMIINYDPGVIAGVRSKDEWLLNLGSNQGPAD